MRFGFTKACLAFGGLVAVASLLGCASGKTSDTSTPTPEELPYSYEKNDAQLKEELRTLRCSATSYTARLGITVPENGMDFEVVGTRDNVATLEVYPGAHQSARVRVCGEGATLMILASLDGPVLVAGDGATIIREEKVSEPKYLRLEGKNTREVVCTRDSAPKPGLPTCRSLMRDDGLLKRW